MSDDLKRSQRQERRGARILGGTVNSGSGNGPWRKNDVRTPLFSIEYKTTTKKQFPLKSSDLAKAEENALLDGNRTMLFGIEMAGRTWMVIDEADFLRILSDTCICICEPVITGELCPMHPDGVL